MGVIIGIVIGGAALLLLNRQQVTASARMQYGPGYQPGAPGPFLPPAPPRLNLPQSTFGGVTQQSDNLSTGVSAGFTGVEIGLSLAKSIPIAGTIVSAAQAIVAPLLAAHKARIAGATNENSHNAAMTSLFDQAIPAIVRYWNQTHDTAGTLSEIQQLQQYMYTTMKSHTGAKGTAWDDATGKAGKCNRQCTAGCCIYWGDFAGGGAPAYTGLNGLIDAVQNGGQRSVTMPKVYPGKYSSFTRPLYTVTLT